MHACMHACMHVCMYVCMCVSSMQRNVMLCYVYVMLCLYYAKLYYVM